MSDSKKMSRRGFIAPSVLLPLAAALGPAGAAEGNASRVLVAYFSRSGIRDGAFVLQADQERQTMEKVNAWLGN